jgi:hypothetical protein
MFWDFLNFLRFFEFFWFFWYFLDFFTHTYSHAHTHTYSHTHILTLTYTHSYTHTLTYTHSYTHTIRIERVIVSISYNKCRDNSFKWNSEVKRARRSPEARWGWMTKREVIVSVWIEKVPGVIKWSKKSYMYSFSYYLGFYNFKIFWKKIRFFLNFFRFSKILSLAHRLQIRQG